MPATKTTASALRAGARGRREPVERPAAGKKMPAAPVTGGGEIDFPAAGPHGKPHLNDAMKTPGTGALPELGNPREGDATAG